MHTGRFARGNRRRGEQVPRRQDRCRVDPAHHGPGWSVSRCEIMLPARWCSDFDGAWMAFWVQIWSCVWTQDGGDGV
eukprot:3289575-Rhodomonas_salina.3